MPGTNLLIKNMVCNRCVLAVEKILLSEAIPFQAVMLGQVILSRALTEDQKSRLVTRFRAIGFELVDSRTTTLVESIKLLATRKARNELNERESKMTLSLYITTSVHHEYTYLSSLFSDLEGRTIEQYFLERRVEKVKELLMDGAYTLSQIAFDLDYSSVSHLSAQFKSITGFTPTCFKEMVVVQQKPLHKA
jgi:AraC-like DNA-binding protein